MEIVLGIDIGGTNTRVGIVDRSGQILLSSRMETRPSDGPESLWSRIWSTAEGMLNRQSNTGRVYRDLFLGIGVGAPNAHSRRGTIEYPPNLGWEIVDFLQIIHQSCDKPAWLSNDANVAALGEGRFGAAKGQKNYLVITLGTGLGSGLVIDGVLVEGSCGFAAEMGHIPIVAGGRRCGCGQKGCLETYVSANGLRRTVMELIAEGSFSTELEGQSFRELSAKDITKAADNGDLLAQEALAICARYLARGLVAVIQLLSPQAIYLGGGLSLAGDWLMVPLRSEVQGLLMPVFRGATSISLASIPEGDLGVLGAAALAFSGLDETTESGENKKNLNPRA